MTAKRFAVFDRDGTCIVERNYLSDPAHVELLPGTARAFRNLLDMGIGLAIVTNQSGIGRGYFSEAQLHAVHRRMAALLADEGVSLPPIFWCPHRPEDGCVCRKPASGLLERAGKELGFDLRTCFVIGDKICDIEMGRRVNATTILVRTGYGRELLTSRDVSADFVAADIAEASSLIITSLLQNNGAAVRCEPTACQQPARVT
ncbi:MAG: D-glycero-alpha-D-manno-heptose-1,7-bisphosphate 7-phosphatase [Pirellulaceae bacterium]